MFLFTQTNRQSVAVVAGDVAVPARVRSEEAPVVCEVGTGLITRPKVEGQSKS